MQPPINGEIVTYERPAAEPSVVVGFGRRLSSNNSVMAIVRLSELE